MRRISALLLFAGCGFSGSSTGGKTADARVIDTATSGDDATAGSDAAVPDDAGCVAGFIDVCDQTPGGPYDVTTATNLNTDTDSHCIPITRSGKSICLIYASEVTITSDGSLTVTGGKGLAIVSTSTMTIDGAIDVASHGAQIGPAADDAGCTFGSLPENDLGGGGGGAGGSFPQNGGNGGIGDNNNSLGMDGQGIGGTHGAAATTITTLRGGCRGQKGGDERIGGNVGGVGGHAGGALYLAARTSIGVAGSIRATGARGEGGQSQAGGGGGGTGGLVVIESPAITIGGQISANGGSGAQGGGRIGTTDISGRPGNDGTLGTSPALGGFGANNNDGRFSTGGNGGAGATAATKGGDSEIGGGGGGGTFGVIRLLGTTSLGGSTISPPPS